MRASKHQLWIGAGFASMIALTGCGINLNEGVATLTSLPVATENGKQLTQYGSMFYTAAELKDGATPAEKVDKNGAASEEKAVKNGAKYKESVIDDGDNVSITIMAAFICDFRELGLPSFLNTSNPATAGCIDGDGGSSPGTRGEIAIIANVVERNAVNGVGATARAYNDLTRAGRVVYYGEDVRETGQLLNIRNLPIYGPIRYDKGAVYLKLSMMELDEEESSQSREVLTQLASLGAQSGIFASAPVLEVLNQLGGALLAQNRDDVEFLFEVQFDPPSTTASVVRAPLMEGYYVLTRQENRSEDLAARFADKPLYLCPKMGWLATDEACGRPFRGMTWILLRISREDDDVALANNAGQAFAEFRASILREAQPKAADFKMTSEGAKAALERLEEDIKGE